MRNILAKSGRSSAGVTALPVASEILESSSASGLRFPRSQPFTVLTGNPNKEASAVSDNFRLALNSSSVMQTIYAERVNTRKRKMRASGLERFTQPLQLLSMSPDATAETAKLNKFLRSWRNSRHFTLEALAALIESKVSTISGWETGRRAVDLEDLAKLAKAYGVHPAALLFAPNEADRKLTRMQAASDLAERMSDGAVDEWLSIGRRLTGDQIERLSD